MKNLANQKFNMLTVIAFSGRDKHGLRLWQCKCDCGNIKVILECNFATGGTKSCGCNTKNYRAKASTTHGKSNTRTYRIWVGMLSRCRDKGRREYKFYGGRGISVCERWYKFENFILDMGECPSKLEIDRIDTNGNYEKSNCRWASRLIQTNNTRRNRRICFNGKNLSLMQWARETNLADHVIAWRLDNGWNIRDSLTRPLVYVRGKRAVQHYGRTK